MRVVHETEDGETTVLASDVDTADTIREAMKGLMFREAVPEDYAFLFDFDRPGVRSVHMLFVKVPLDVLWLREDTVRKRKTLAPWRGFGITWADTIVELPEGAANGVESGDAVYIEDGDADVGVDGDEEDADGGTDGDGGEDEDGDASE